MEAKLSNVICRRCNRKLPAGDALYFDGFAYHDSCLPRAAREGCGSPARVTKKNPFVIRLYDKLVRECSEKGTGNVEQICAKIGPELNCHPRYIEHWINQLAVGGYLKREFNTLQLVKRPEIS